MTAFKAYTYSRILYLFGFRTASLAMLRVALEKHIQRLHGTKTRMTAGEMLRDLYLDGVISKTARRRHRNLYGRLSSAAHGGNIENSAKLWNKADKAIHQLRDIVRVEKETNIAVIAMPQCAVFERVNRELSEV